MTTIRDNVEAVHRLLTEELKVKHLRAIVGFSMGAQQAFQWAVSYPEFADKIVATAGTAKTYPHGVVRLEGQIAALTADVAFQNGDYTAPPKKGLEAFATVWTAWLFSQEWWRKELWKASSPPGTTFEQTLHEFRTNFIPGADANNLILQCRTWEKHDVGATLRALMATWRKPCGPSKRHFFICHRKPTFIFRLAMRATRRLS